jgi:hypothetical protein
MRNLQLNRRLRDRIYQAATAVFAFALCWAAAAPIAFGQSACPQPPSPVSTDPQQTIIPVHLDASTGNITVGSTTYCGQNPGFHLLALQRQPNIVNKQLKPPLMVWDQTYTDGQSVANDLSKILTTYPDAVLIINGVGNYGFTLADKHNIVVGGIPFLQVSIGWQLRSFGAYLDLDTLNATIPFVFIGNGGRNQQTALQRGYSTGPLDGYLTPDSNGNYTFAQMDFVRYDIATDGSITVGQKTYTVADSYRVNCDGQNAFHIMVLDRETLQLANAFGATINNTYCTAQSDFEINRLIGDTSQHTNNEGLLVFIASNGHPIPANWNFGTDGDSRIYPLAQQVAQLGGYWETMVYLTPQDTYSLVGVVAPPAGTPQPRPRAQESSSVYPGNVNGQAPSGELHGVLARGRSNWYSPLNADPTGLANLDLYGIIAQAPVAFPHPDPNNADEVNAFTTILQNVCTPSNQPQRCDPKVNPRNQYGDLSVDIGSTYQTPLQAIAKDPQGNDCSTSSSAYCTVRAQLLDEFTLVSNIHKFQGNVTDLWSSSGTVTLGSQLSAFNDIKATIPAPPPAPAPSLVSPLVNLFLGLGSFIPEAGPAFGLADLFFNFGTSLTTDQQGNQTVDLTSTIGQLEQQATNQFIAQANTTGTLFEFIYQDWGRINALGTALVSASGSGSPWYWSSTTTSNLLQAIAPAVKTAAYQSLMPAAYSIGSYVPDSDVETNWGWGKLPLTGQPYAYVVGVDRSCVCTPISHPFWAPAYSVYSNPTDYATSGFANQPGTGTILADGAWLAISLQSTPLNGQVDNFQYSPPDQSLLANLFKPLSQSGLGVYRPAFFEGWAFPRLTCGLSYGDRNGYSYSGGCDWGSGKAEPPPLPPGPPVTSLSLQATQISSNGDEVDVRLAIYNNGTTIANSINLSSIMLNTLAGSGQAALLNPGGPVQIGRLVPGDSTQVILKINVPPSIKKLGMTETGSIDWGQPSQVTQISNGQVLYPRR